VTRRRPARRRRAEALKQQPVSEVIGSKLRLFGVGILCLKLALVPLIFDRGADVPFSVVKALFSHALAYVLAAIIIALTLRFGVSFLRWSALHVPVLAFLGVNILATVFAVDPLVALYGTHGRMIGLGTIADGVVLYFAVVLLVRTRTDAWVLVASVLGSSIIVLGYEFVQVLGRDPFLWSADGAIRPFSTLGQTTSLAEYLTVLVIGVVALAAFGRPIARGLRVLLLVYAGALFAGLVLTQTRSALVGLATGGGVLLILIWIAHPHRRARVVSMIGAIVSLAVLGVVLVLTPLGARVLGTVEISASAEGDAGTGPRLEQSADVRLAFYRMAFEIVKERPILGYGPDNFVFGVPKYRTATEPFEVQQSIETSAHGWLSGIAAATGLAGIGAFVALVLTATAVTLRRGYLPVAWIGAGMLAAFLGAGLTTVNELGTEWLLWTSLGTIAASTASPWPWPKSANTMPSHGRRANRDAAGLIFRPVGYVAIGAAVVLAFATLNALDASRSAQASQDARVSSRTQQAVDLARHSATVDPRRGDYWDTLGLAYVQAERLDDAVAAFRHASDLAPYDFRYSGDLARGYLELVQKGDQASAAHAREVADRSVQMDPNNPVTHLTRAVVMQVTGDFPEALKSAERAIELDQTNNREIYLTATQVLIGLGRPSDAVDMARRGIARIPDPRNQVPLRVELARALALNGQLTEALNEIAATLVVSPSDPAAQQLRAQLQAGVVR